MGDGAVYTVTEEDDARIREIAAERFASWESVYGADPAFNIQRTGRFAGGKMDFRLEVRKGLICHAAVFGDFFPLWTQRRSAASWRAAGMSGRRCCGRCWTTVSMGRSIRYLQRRWRRLSRIDVSG